MEFTALVAHKIERTVSDYFVCIHVSSRTCTTLNHVDRELVVVLTVKDFLASCEFVKKAEFLTVHIFPYSKRAGTPAATMKGQISTEEKSRRLHELEKICQENTAKLLSREVAERDEREVLFETFKDGHAYGHTDDFLEICVPSERDMRGEIAKVKLISSDGKQILAALEK